MTGFILRGDLGNVRLVAAGATLRALRRLRKQYGHGRWRKLKGNALVELPDGQLALAELHWYEAHGVGRREMKVKELLD